MVDALDSKSSSLTGVSVQVGPGAPTPSALHVSNPLAAAPRRGYAAAMDARTTKRKMAETVNHAHELAEAFTAKRDRLLAALTLIAGVGLIVALPFALRAGAEFFLPVTAALVVAIALVPLLEWFERRGIPSRLASALCLLIFLTVTVFAIGSIVLPAIDWITLIPERIGKVQAALSPLLDLYKSFDRFVERILSQIAISPDRSQMVTIETPNSLSGLLATSAPHILIQLFFALLVIFFFLAGWTTMRKRTIVSRGSFEGALTTARVIQQVVDATSIYIGTITLINVTLGALTALVLWQLGMDSPIMWGGIVAVLNYIPYLGPIGSAMLLFFGGLMTLPDVWSALLPPLIFTGLHLMEANFVTPMTVSYTHLTLPTSDLV